MEGLTYKLENLFLKAGQKNLYHYVVTLLFTLEFMCTHLLYYSLPYLERVPEVYLEKTEQDFSYSFCSNDTYIFKQGTKKKSLVIEFDIFCSKRKIYFLGLCYCVGKVIGSCLSYLLIDKIGRVIILYVNIPISIVLMGVFKFMKESYTYNWIYGIYVDLFLSGICNYIIIVDVLIYLSEIIQQTRIPYFIMVVVTGSPLAGLICSISFSVDSSLTWRNIFLIFAGIHLLVYIALLIILKGSPMYALNQEQFLDFYLNLKDIASINGKKLTSRDFEFLAPYIPRYLHNQIYTEPGQLQSLDHINTLTDKSFGINDTVQNMIIDKPKTMMFEDNMNNNEVTYVNINNEISSKNDFTTLNRTKSIFNRNVTNKDIYLLSSGEDVDYPVKSLFGDVKMDDFTPLDLLRFKSQIKNFLTLSAIWILTLIIRNSIDFRKKYIADYIGKIQYSIINYTLDMFLPVVLLLIFRYRNYSIHKMLILAHIIEFIFFVLSCYFIQKANVTSQIVFLILGKISLHCIYLILYVITCEIYPIIIRTKGVGFNIGISGIGTIVSIFLAENLKFDTLMLYFLLFIFFSAVFCYNLPNKIGTLLLDIPKKDINENDVKLGDICVENAILVGSSAKKDKDKDKDEKINDDKTKEENKN